MKANLTILYPPDFGAMTDARPENLSTSNRLQKSTLGHNSISNRVCIFTRCGCQMTANTVIGLYQKVVWILESVGDANGI